MKEKKEVYKVKPLTEGKKNIIANLIEEYDIKTTEDIQEALKDLLGGTIKSMLEAKMIEHIGYEKYQHSDGTNYRNGTNMIICADGLTGIKEAIATAFPQTEYQHCVVHQVRNILKYVSYKDKKEFASDLKSIYLAATEIQAMENLDKVIEKCEEKYPNSMSSWYQNWDVLTPIFKFSLEVRKVIYTTNAIESLNSTYKKLNR